MGTVGGGTRLPALRRNPELLGRGEGPHAARKLAEIVAASAAALELSLMAAVVSGTFAQAHRKYSRNSSPAEPRQGSRGAITDPEDSPSGQISLDSETLTADLTGDAFMQSL